MSIPNAMALCQVSVMDLSNQRRVFHEFSLNYLHQLLPAAQAKMIISEHLDLADGSQTICPLSELYFGLLFSAQNVQGKPNQIGLAIKGLENLSKITGHFDPHWVVAHYADAGAVFQAVLKKLKPAGRINHSEKGVWPKYCRSIYTAAQFFSRFKDGEDFYQWANRMYGDLRSQDALPMLIERDVFGVGYALACDFLKEKGFLDYGKPDTHVIDILNHVGLCQEGMPASAYQDEIRAIALASGTSAYSVDKLIWLIGSNDFYKSANKPMKDPQAKRKFLQAWSKQNAA
jgi:hypothetical protein